MFSFKTFFAATACATLAAATPSPRACSVSDFAGGFYGTLSNGGQGTQVDVSFTGLKAGQSPLSPLLTSQRASDFDVSSLAASVVDSTLDIYNPGNTPIDQVITSFESASNKLSGVASVGDGASKVNLNVVVQFAGAVSSPA